MPQDDFGDRMKDYEGREASRKLIPTLPICVRLDGKGFSKFTKGLARPYDERLSRLMIDTAKFLVKESNACVGYTQSDEISLILWEPEYKSQVYFDGKVQKLCSVLSSMATAFFNKGLAEAIPEKKDYMALFDCRVWNVPDLNEAANTLLWRELDASKNSISMAASHYYSHRELEGKSGSEKQEMLFQKGINWNDYPAFFKRGVFVKRKQVIGNRPLTDEEIQSLPPLHNARKDKTLKITKLEVIELDMPPFSKVANRVEVIFEGETPVLYSDKE